MEMSSMKPLISRCRKLGPTHVRATSGRLRPWIPIVVCSGAIIATVIFDLIMYGQYLKIHPKQGKFKYGPVHPAPKHTSERAPLCNSSTCLWTANFLGRTVNNEAEPCHDFSAFVCSTDRVSLLLKKMHDFMRAMMKIYGRRLHTDATEDDALMFRDCAQGRRGILDVVLRQVDWAAVATGCNITYPRTPLRIAEIYTKKYLNVSVEGFKKFLFRRASVIRNLLIRSERPHVQLPASHWAAKAALWVSQAAACHHNERFDSAGDVNTYAVLWKVLYFSPFLTSVYKALHQKALLRGRRMIACLEVVDDVFPVETRLQSYALLKSFNHEYEEEMGALWHDLAQKLQHRLKFWGGNESSVFNFLNATTTRLLPANITESQPIALLETSASYSADHNEVFVPMGLLTLLFFNTSVVDTTVVPYLGSAIMEPVFRSPNLSSWSSGDVVAWNTHLACIATNTSDRQILQDISAAHILLSPLYWTYVEHIAKQYATELRLNANFTNEQLFFVLWAAGRCGSSSELVNGPLLHSERFTKAFHCVTGQGMVPAKRCPFWLR